MRRNNKEKIKINIDIKSNEKEKEEERVKSTVCAIVTVVLAFFLTIIVGGLISWSIMVFWNCFLTNYFNIATIGFFDAMSIFGIIWVIVYGFKTLFAAFQSINSKCRNLYDEIDFENEDDD